MSKYLEIISNNGNALIDDESSRIVFLRKITLSRNNIDYEWKNAWNGGDDWNNQVAASGSKFTVFRVAKGATDKVCFAKCTNPDFGISCYSDAGGHYCVVFYDARIHYSNLNPSSITMYIFGEPTLKANNYGLEIRNASGNIVFNSDMKMLNNIKGIWQQKITWSKVNGSPSYVASSISSNNTAISTSCIPGHGDASAGGEGVIWYAQYLPVHFETYLTARLRVLYTPTEYYSTNWKSAQVGPVGNGMNLIAIDVSNY